MTTKHTPTPWIIEAQARVSAHCIVDVDCIPIAEVRVVGRSEKGRGTASDVEFLVEACNAYETNVARIAKLEAALRSIYAHSGARGVNAEYLCSLASAALEKETP